MESARDPDSDFHLETGPAPAPPERRILEAGLDAYLAAVPRDGHLMRGEELGGATARASDDPPVHRHLHLADFTPLDLDAAAIRHVKEPSAGFHRHAPGDRVRALPRGDGRREDRHPEE